MKIDFPIVSRVSFQRNSKQSVRNRCPVMFQPSGDYIWIVFSCNKNKNKTSFVEQSQHRWLMGAAFLVSTTFFLQVGFEKRAPN
jgi:hypothetical protein